MMPVRMVFFPWLFLPHPGTIAADTDYYPFGTIMWVEGYGKGVVEDRGSAIKGPERLDVFFRSHWKARKWGRQTVPVRIKVKDRKPPG
jgi:3D (Asp-Asp-Asp) domain-containing protein